MYSDDYLPRGPSDSASIRTLAEIKYAELMGSAAVNDRAKFVEWSQELNNELLCLAETLIDSRKTMYMRSSNKSDKSNGSSSSSSGGCGSTINFATLITDDMKLPCTSSLEKLKNSREQLSRYLAMHDTGNEFIEISPLLPDKSASDGPLRASGDAAVNSSNVLRQRVASTIHTFAYTSENDINATNGTSSNGEASEWMAHQELPRKSYGEPTLSPPKKISDEDDYDSTRGSSEGVDCSGDWKNSKSTHDSTYGGRLEPSLMTKATVGGGSAKAGLRDSIDLSALSSNHAKSIPLLSQRR